MEETSHGDTVYGLGIMEDADRQRIGLFYTDVRHGDVTRKRVGLRRVVEPYIKANVDAALAVFDDGRHWRLSFVTDLQGQTTAPKRFSYVMGDPQGQYRTPVDRLSALGGTARACVPTLAAIREAFSVDTLSDDFFKEYHQHYDRIVEYMTVTTAVETHGRASLQNPAKIHDYVKKMLGRIVFLHFLQKKGWLCGDPNFMRNTFLNSRHRDNYLESVLEPLFFGMLNTEPEKRERVFRENSWDIDILAQWSGTSANSEFTIPYLNGGLFERDEVDKMNIRLPASLFNDLFTFLASYNFTVDENDPDDAEIGVDPEMLGKIFESLLEDNKAKGAFYTPKEIVRYMCKESLIAYLNTKMSACGDARPCVSTDTAIRTFVETHEFPDELEPYRDILDRALREVKICDPAIGSGAFPMGLLNELWRCREALAVSDSCSLITVHRSQLKKEIIENNIYGVDIERGAIDIARLRFWLSIVVDSDEPEALPNFDYKFMQGNSLIESFEGVDLSRMMSSDGQHSSLGKGRQKAGANQLGIEFVSTDTKRNLQLMLREYFSLTDHVKKAEARREINDSVKNYIRQQDLRSEAVARLASLDPSANQEFFLWHTWFKDIFDAGGFDIIIANPPYVKEYINKGAFDGFRETSPYYLGKMDLWYGFACHGLDMLKKKKGILCFIAQNNWTTSAGAKKMREKVIKDSQIIQILDFNTYMVFENADIQTMIMMFKRDQKNDNYKFDYRIITQGNEKEDMLALLGKKDRNTKYLLPMIKRETFINSLLTFSDNEQIVDKISRDKTYLQAKEIGQGIVPALDDYFILYSTDGYNEEEKCYIKPYYTGLKDRYVSYPLEKYLIYMSAKNFNQTQLNNYPNLKKHFEPHRIELTEAKEKYGTPNKPYFFVHRERDENFFRAGNEKIVSQVRCKYPTFYYTTDAFYGSRALFFIRSTRWNMKFLVGVLNSSLITYWIKNKGKQQGELFKLDKEPLQGIPLPIVDISQQKPIIALVDQILSAKKSNPNADTSALEREIDKIVYELYGLTEEEVKVVEGK